MSLRLFFTSLDTVPEHLKSEYVPDKECGFRLRPSKPSTGAGGSGTRSQEAPPVNINKTMSRAQFDELSAHDKVARMRAGFTLYD
jgi:hypothetical protein